MSGNQGKMEDGTSGNTEGSVPESDTSTIFKKHKIEHSRIISIYLMVYDAVAVSLSYFLALLLRFDFTFSHIPVIYYEPWLKFAPIYAVFCIIIFAGFRLYKSIWRFASYTELSRVIMSSVVTSTFHILATLIFLQRMPISYYLMGGIMQFVLIAGIRFAYRFILLLRGARDKNELKRIMIIGMHSIIGTT